MASIKTASLLMCFWLAMIAANPASAQQTRYRAALLIPAFEGPGALGMNVSTVMNLKVFGTLRKAPPRNARGVSFGNGIVYWMETPLEEFSHAAAEQLADQVVTDADEMLVLWGKASRYADGVLVQSNLTLPVSKKAQAGSYVWQLALYDKVILGVDLPRRRYSLGSIILDPEIVRLYTSPAALKVYRDKTQRDEIGFLNNGLFKAEGHEKNGSWLVEPVRGWVPLPRLSETPNETIEFTAAMIRILRADWEGAADMLRSLASRPTTPVEIQIDASLIIGLTEEKQGRSGRKEFERAYRLNPFYRASAAYLIMNAFADYRRAITTREEAGGRAVVERLDALLLENRPLFASNDSWFMRVTAARQTMRQIR